VKNPPADNFRIINSKGSSTTFLKVIYENGIKIKNKPVTCSDVKRYRFTTFVTL
jgi:hypothetical protein